MSEKKDIEMVFGREALSKFIGGETNSILVFQPDHLKVGEEWTKVILSVPVRPKVVKFEMDCSKNVELPIEMVGKKWEISAKEMK